MGHDHLSFVLAVQSLAMVLDVRENTTEAHEAVGAACAVGGSELLAGLQATNGDYGEMARQFVNWKRQGGKPDWIAN